MSTILIAAGAVIALLVVFSVVRSRFERVVVFEYERGLRYEKGRFTGEVGPGRHWVVRNLANAARMMSANPALLQLLLLQELGKSAGNTIVLGLPSTTTPLPLRGAPGDVPETPELPPSDE